MFFILGLVTFIKEREKMFIIIFDTWRCTLTTDKMNVNFILPRKSIFEILHYFYIALHTEENVLFLLTKDSQLKMKRFF